MILYERLGANNFCPSPIGYRVRIALQMKGMDCRREPMRFADVDRLERETGSRTCPALVDGEARFGTSDAIIRHLDTVQPAKPVFTDDDNALDLAALENEFGIRAGKVVAPWLVDRLCPEDRDYYRSSREEKFDMSFTELVAHRSALELDLAFTVGRIAGRMGRNPFFSGGRPGFFDAVIYGYLLWIEFADASALPELPAEMAAWYEARDVAWRHACLAPFK